MASVRSMVAVLNSHGKLFTGDNVVDMARGWLDYGFSPAEADEWCEIGVWEPGIAATLKNAGLTPYEVNSGAERLYEAEPEKGCPIYSVCNGDTNISVIIEEARKV
jgi:hypothetical protein